MPLKIKGGIKYENGHKGFGFIVISVIMILGVL